MRKSICDCHWMKKIPYEFFKRSILCENIIKYEINAVYSILGEFVMQSKVTSTFRKIELKSILLNDF